MEVEGSGMRHSALLDSQGCPQEPCVPIILGDGRTRFLARGNASTGKRK
jgi:hypothetical protein